MTVWRNRRARVFLGAAAVLLTVQVSGRAMAQGAPADTAGPPAVPVSVAPVVRSDVPQILRGLGAVQAYYSVQVRPQVDGLLLQIPVTEGQTVRKGDLLAVIDTRPYQAALDAASAKKQQDEALLANAQADLRRYDSLARQDYASRQQVDTQTALVRQYTAAIAIDTALIETAQVNLSFCAIRAPFDGRVGLRITDPGAFVRAAEATPILPVSQLQPIAVIFTVPQDNLPAIQAAMAEGKPPVTAVSGDNTVELDQGTLLTIDNSIDPTTGTIKIKALFPNEQSKLWPGQFVNARLTVGVSRGALTVPSIAVQHGQSELFVYVVKADQTVERRKVEVARDDGATAVIASGLEEGQRAVIDGHSRLRNGTRVAVVTTGPKEAANPQRPGG